MRFPGSMVHEKCYPVQVEGSLTPGTSGTPIYNATNNKIVGIVVAANIKGSVLFVMPAFRILEDILARSKGQGCASAKGANLPGKFPSENIYVYRNIYPGEIDPSGYR